MSVEDKFLHRFPRRPHGPGRHPHWHWARRHARSLLLRPSAMASSGSATSCSPRSTRSNNLGAYTVSHLFSSPVTGLHFSVCISYSCSSDQCIMWPPWPESKQIPLAIGSPWVGNLFGKRPPTSSITWFTGPQSWNAVIIPSGPLKPYNVPPIHSRYDKLDGKTSCSLCFLSVSLSLSDAPAFYECLQFTDW